MRRFILLFAVSILLIIPEYLPAGEIYPIDKSDIPDAVCKKPETYDGSSLYGYIDGGADLYMEYGFTSLAVQEIELRGESFKIEIYTMQEPLSAFGIYSVSHLNCQNGMLPARFYCINPYQIQIAHGNRYISIINNTGTPKAQEITLELAKTLIEKIIQPAICYPFIFQNEIFKPYISSLQFINGKLGLQNGYSDWSNRFDGFKDYQIFLLPVNLSKKFLTVALISFSEPKDKDDFLNKVDLTAASGKKNIQKKFGKITRAAWILSDTKLILLESNEADGNITPFSDAIEKSINEEIDK